MKDLERFIVAEWGLSGVEINKTLQETGERKVFLIRTVEDTVIVKLFNPELTEDQITRYTYALTFLDNNAFCNAPKLIRLSNGKTFTKYNGQYIYLMEFIEGTFLAKIKMMNIAWERRWQTYIKLIITSSRLVLM